MTERDIFLAVLDLPDPVARAAYLDRACADDPAARAKVEALLAAHDGAGSFLGTPLVPPHGPEYAATKDFTADTDGEGEDGDRGPADAVRFLAPPARPGALGRLGHYEVLQILGQGAFGVVFRAFDDILQRVVAVKVLSPQMAATSPARKRFLREARSSAAIRHENVVQVYEVGETPLPYLVMEFIPGETLQQRLDRTGPVEAAEVVRIGRQVAEGLAAAHQQGLIHRDIKPGNILLDGPHLRVKITDFGLARAADDASISQSGIIAGTPMYMSPEQARGEHLDARSDLFSLGSVLYQMVTGRPPFRATGTLAVLKRVCEDTPRPVREVIPETPRWLADIIAKLHAKDADRRFQTAREVADLLARCEEGLKVRTDPHGFPAVTPEPKPEPEPKLVPRGLSRRACAAALAACALAVAVAVAVPQLRRDRGPAGPGPEPAADGTDPAAEAQKQQAAKRAALKKAAPKDAVLLMSFDEGTFARRGDRVEVRDLSGRGNHAAGDRMGHTPDGKVGGGLRCGGGGLALARSLIALQSEYTVTAWCRLDPANRGDDFRILRTSGSSGVNFPIYRFEIAADRSCLAHAWNMGRARPRDPEQWVAVGTPPDAVPDGWVFVAVTLTGGGLDKGALRIVVDDKVVHRKSQVVGPEADAADYIGWKNAGGVIDELTVFPRALSDAEIAALRELGRNDISLAELVAPSEVGPKVEPKTSPPAPATGNAGVPPKMIRGNESCITFQYSPDGKWLVTRDYVNKQVGALRVWEVATGEARATIPNSGTRGGAFSPDGKLLAHPEHDGGRIHLVVRNVGTFEVVRRWPCDAENVEGIAFDRTGTVVAACADRAVILWAAATGAEVLRLTGDFNYTLGLAFSPTADRLLLQGGRGAFQRDGRWDHDSRIHLYDTDPKSPTYKQRLHTWDAPNDGYAFGAVHFSPDGARVLFCRGEQGLTRVAVHDVTTGAKVRDIVPQQTYTQISVGAVSPDGKRLALRHGPGLVHLGVWNLDTGERVSGFDLTGQAHRAFAVDPTFRTACVGFHNNPEAKFYDLATGKEQVPGSADARPGWAVLLPAEAKAANGTTLTARPGGAVLASGKLPDTDTYTLTFDAPPGRLAALRLDVLPHDSLPNKGPGRHPHPDMPFVLSAVRAAVSDPGAAGGWREVKLARAWADHSSGDDATPPLVLDADDNTGWGAEAGKPHFLVVAPDEPLAVPTGARLRVTLEFKHRDAQRHLGHFRLSAAAVRPLEPLPEAELKRIAALPPLEQVEAVREELKRRNPGFDGTVTPTIDFESGAVVGLKLSTRHVADLSPVRALAKLRKLDAQGTGGTGRGVLADLSPLKGLPLTELTLSVNAIADLSPLAGMPLTDLHVDNSLVSDLSPLKGMPLRTLNCSYTQVSDLSPLKGAPLGTIWTNHTEVSDLSPLKDAPLDWITFQNTKVTDTSVLKGKRLSQVYLDFDPKRDAALLRGIPTLEKINDRPAAEFLKGVPELPGGAAGPFTDADVKRVAALPAAEQVEEARKELKKRNPGFDGTLVPTIEEGAVIGLEFSTEFVTDVSPVRGLAKLRALRANGPAPGRGRLADLSPLAGLALTEVMVQNNRVTDLTPLGKLPLARLWIDDNPATDLAPLRELPLRTLGLNRLPLRDLDGLRGLKLERLSLSDLTVTDLAPLKGMPLRWLNLLGTPVADLAPLQGMPLKHLNLQRTKVRDLGPLKGLPLTHLLVSDTAVTDLSPLTGTPLVALWCDYKPDRDGPVLRGIPTLEEINAQSAADVLKGDPAPPAEPFTDADVRRVAALPAAEQVEEVRKELKKRNPKFDGTLAPAIAEGAVVGLEFCTDEVSDIAPVRALAGLKRLTCRGTEAKGKLADLSPLKGLPLTALDVNNNSRVVDLSPLNGLPLKELYVHHTGVRDLSPLKGAPLENANVSHTGVSDLGPLADARLQTLYLDNSSVADLSPLKGLPLKHLNLRGLKLDPARDHAIVRELSQLESVNGESVVDFLKTPPPAPN